MPDAKSPLRGADIVARSLEQLGCDRIFTLSGNHIMSLFDAALETKLDLVHVRHEAAAVHMADAWGRLTRQPGIAMVTGGPGHANAVGALYTALAAESPMVLLSGHAATWEIGRGGFQEIRQAEMAAPVTKASWTAQTAATLGRDIEKAMRLAISGRPGPVHVSLPSDLLDEPVAGHAIAWPDHKPAASAAVPLAQPVAEAVLAALASARKPLIIAGPQLSYQPGRALLARLEAAVNTPVVIMESPRGANDATLGAFSDLLRHADLIVLLGKALDFTLRWAAAPLLDPASKLMVIDPEAALLDRATTELGDRLLLASRADVSLAAESLIRHAAATTVRDGAWLGIARHALDSRPAAWNTVASTATGTLHPATVFQAVRAVMDRHARSLLICDGGEFAQWGQSLLSTERRLVNGVAGSIGASIPFALAARIHEPDAPVIAVMGDGTFGFHMAEFETAVRRNLPFIAIVGNDACWNAESQIQRRDYGAQRMHGCDLLPSRYDQVVTALGGHGELVDTVAAMGPALERALASGKPACINVMIESVAAPVIRHPA